MAKNKRKKSEANETVAVNNLIVQFLTRHYHFDVTPHNYFQVRKPREKAIEIVFDPTDALYNKVKTLFKETPSRLITNEIYTALYRIRLSYPDHMDLYRHRAEETNKVRQSRDSLKMLSQNDKNKIIGLRLLTQSKNPETKKAFEEFGREVFLMMQSMINDAVNAEKKLLEDDKKANTVGLGDNVYARTNQKEPPTVNHIATIQMNEGTYQIDVTGDNILKELNQFHLKNELIRSVQWRLRALLRYHIVESSGKLRIKKKPYSDQYVTVNDKDTYPIIIELSKEVFNDYTGEKTATAQQKINAYLKAKEFSDFTDKQVEALFSG